MFFFQYAANYTTGAEDIEQSVQFEKLK